MSEQDLTTTEVLQRLNAQLRDEVLALHELTTDELLAIKHTKPHLALPAMFLWIERREQHNPSPAKLKSHYVYVLQNTANQYVKIGYTADPDQRLRHWECTTVDELRLIGVWQVPHSKVERELQELFENVRMGHNRSEWFALTESDIDILVELMLDFERVR